MKIVTALIAFVMTLALAGCGILPGFRDRGGSEVRNSSSLVDFLYPNGQRPPLDNSIPELQLPVRVGLAFLPGPHGVTATGLEAARRDELLERIRQHFLSRKFISQIVIVPDYYLSDRTGMQGLRSVQRLYNIDLLALVSYDQVSYRDENNWSLGYLTIVGAFVLKGTRHDVTTLLDLAVVDPASRSLILRAGGMDQQHGTTTLVSETRATRESRTEGFDRATDQLIEHFDLALTKFESDVREGKAGVNVIDRNGRKVSGGGGGSLDWAWLAVLALLVLARRREHNE